MMITYSYRVYNPTELIQDRYYMVIMEGGIFTMAQWNGEVFLCLNHGKATEPLKDKVVLLADITPAPKELTAVAYLANEWWEKHKDDKADYRDETLYPDKPLFVTAAQEFLTTWDKAALETIPKEEK